jgi:hypothetical protein
MFCFRRQDSDDMTPRSGSYFMPQIMGVLAIACLFFLPSAVEATAAFFQEDEPDWLALKASSTGATNLALLPASPDCWLDAIQALKIHTGSVLEDAFHATSSEGESHPLTSVTCSWLTAVDQKVLALELSKCHMRDLGRPLFHFDSEEDHKACVQTLKDYSKVQEQATNGRYPPSDQSITSRNIATKCLARLTDSGVNSYTHFFSYVNQLCTRLLSEYVLGQYYETSYQLARSSKVAEGKIQSLIEQQDLLFHRWNEREEHVLGLYDQLEAHVEKQTTGLESKIGRLRMKLEEEHEHWKLEYARFQENLAKELERHQKEFAFFSSIVRKVQDSMAAWTSAVDSLWKSAKIGHSAFQGVFLTTGGIFSCLMLTWIGPLRWMRKYMIFLLVTELMVEVAVLVTIVRGGEQGLLWRDAYLDQCETVRSFLFKFLCGCYAFGVMKTIVYRRKGPLINQEEEDSKQEVQIVHNGSSPLDGISSGNATRRQAAPSFPQNLHQHVYDSRMTTLTGQPVPASAFQPVWLHHGSARTCSKDDSAVGTDTSQEIPDQVTVPPGMIGMPAFGMHPHMVLAPYQLGQNPSSNLVNRIVEPLAGRSTAPNVATAVGVVRLDPPGNAGTTTLLANNHLQQAQGMSSGNRLDSPRASKESEAITSKRPHSNLSEDESGEDPPTKRPRNEEQDVGDTEEGDNMETEAENLGLEDEPDTIFEDDSEESEEDMET